MVGLDADPDALAIGRGKISAAGVDVELREGLAFAPPFPAESFDRVVSSLLFHHLSLDAKRQTFGAVHELLAPGGELHVLDRGRAQNLLMRAAFLGVQLLDGFPNTLDNVRGRLVPLMEEAGLVDAAETHRETTLFGTLSLYRAVRAAGR